MKILICDDSKVMRSLVRRTLRRAGYGSHDIVEAGDGKEGKVVFDNESPGLVLSDWNMPEMNGLEFLKSVRGDGSKVPFVFVTTEGTAEMRAKADEAGATGFLVKPFTEDDVTSALDTYLG